MRQQLNILVDNSNLQDSDFEIFFSSPIRHDWDVLGMDEGESVLTVKPGSVDILDLLVLIGVFPSKSQARKNWTRSGIPIPEGFSDFEHIGKLHHRITILNPRA